MKSTMLFKTKLGLPPAGSSFQPSGWVRRQLEIQAAGLAGNLDRIWRDVRDSAWIGGTADGWERVPYWLDGFIDLAWLLDDTGMQQRARKYIDAILQRQQPDGWLCPCSGEQREKYDMWPLFLLGKVLIVWEHRSGDERVFPALYKAFKQLSDHLKSHPLFRWDRARWYEGLITVGYLYAKTGESWLPKLAEILKEQGSDLHEKLRLWRWTEKEKEWTFEAHVVNNAMELHADLLYQMFHPEKGDDGEAFAAALLKNLRQYHSTVYGHFTGDECLAGDSPVQGTELCGIVEAMFSAELLLAATGRGEWGDYLESLAFNALPAACSEDMWAHQYDQQTNQICCRNAGKVIWTTNGGEANVFGLEPNFGCCTANFGQGWPKFAANTFLLKEETVTAALLLPGRLKTILDGKEIVIEQTSAYPFRKEGVLEVTAPETGAEFTLRIRIPGTVRSARINGEEVAPGRYWECCKKWYGKTVLPWDLTIETQIIVRPNGLQALRHGALIYALPIASRKEPLEYERSGVERKFPYCDWELFPTEEWGYGFADDSFTQEEGEIGEFPFSESAPPCWISADMQQVPWGTVPGTDHTAAPVPEKCSPATPPVRKKLIPYGCTKLRMTEMPRIKNESRNDSKKNELF